MSAALHELCDRMSDLLDELTETQTCSCDAGGPDEPVHHCLRCRANDAVEEYARLAWPKVEP